MATAMYDVDAENCQSMLLYAANDHSTYCTYIHVLFTFVKFTIFPTTMLHRMCGWPAMLGPFCQQGELWEASYDNPETAQKSDHDCGVLISNTGSDQGFCASGNYATQSCQTWYFRKIPRGTIAACFSGGRYVSSYRFPQL